MKNHRLNYHTGEATAYARKIVAENIMFLDHHDLDEAQKQVMQKLIRKQIGFYPTASPFAELNVFDFTQTLEYNLERFEKFMAKNFGTASEREDFKVLYEHFSLFRSYYFKRMDTTKNSFYLTVYGENNLFHFIRHLVNGKPDADLTEANRLKDYFKAQGHNAVLPMQTEAESKTPQMVSFKWFGNGRLDIKGLTDEQLEKVDYYIQFAAQKRNLQKVFDSE